MAIPKYMEETSKVGRPVAFKTVEELETAIEKYFTDCDNRIKAIVDKEGNEIAIHFPEPYTMSGLAYALEIDRQTLINYGKKQEFFGTVKKARNKVQIDVERRLMETRNQAGAIFSLKNNFGWRDKTEVDETVHLPQPLLSNLDVQNNDSSEEAEITQEEG